MQKSGRVPQAYQVKAKIGHGGGGEVYRAVHVELRRVVALKIPLFDGDPRGVLARFSREARALAALRHPNIVRVLDADVGDDAPFLAMELLGSRTLRAVLRQPSRRPLGQSLNLMRQAADALDHCHQNGFVHRDVKPSNFIVGAQDHLTLIDFGLAFSPDGLRVTCTGEWVGTPLYAAPEVMRGLPAMPPADIYALGLCSYQMLGAPDCNLAVTGAGSAADLTAAVRALGVQRPELPASLLALLLRMLAPDPTDRPTAAKVSSMIATIRERVAMSGHRRSARSAAPVPATALSTCAALAQELGRRVVRAAVGLARRLCGGTAA